MPNESPGLCGECKEKSDAINPFLRRARIARSPVRKQILTPEQERAEKHQYEHKTPDMEKSDTQQQKEEEREQATKRESDGEPLHVMGEKIKELISMMEVQRHINIPMKDLVSAIERQHQKALDMHSISKPPTMRANQSSQTDTMENDRKKQGKRARTAANSGRDAPNSPQQIAKCIRLELPRGPIEARPKEQQHYSNQPKEAVAVKKQSVAAVGMNASLGVEGTQPREGWSTVVKHKTKTTQKIPTKPDALVLKKVGELSYAEMLKQIKSQPELKELSHIVKGIRKTAKDELLFELKRQADPATEKLKTAIEGVLGASAQVRSLTQEATIQIKDIDEVTSREEVIEAIKNSLPDGNVALSGIRAMYTAYGGTQTCTVSLPSAAAQKMLSLSKIRIGWVYCRIREKTTITRCYKCHDFGHLARNCKSEDDRTTQCFRCGGQDHKAKNCVNTPRCALCLQHGEGDTNHVSGGRTCPAFQREAQQKKV